MMEENESYKIYLRIGQKAGYFSIPFALAEKTCLQFD